MNYVATNWLGVIDFANPAVNKKKLVTKKIMLSSINNFT